MITIRPTGRIAIERGASFLAGCEGGLSYVEKNRLRPLAEHQTLARQLALERMHYAVALLQNSVTIDDNVRSGVPVLKNTRITISRIFAELAEGYDVEEIAAEFEIDPSPIRSFLQGLSIRLDSPLFDG